MISADRFLVRETAPIQELLDVLARQVSGTYGSGFAIVVDADGRMVGTCTDADISKYLRRHSVLPESTGEVAQRGFAFLDGLLDPDQQQRAVSKIFEERGWLTEVPTKLIPVVVQGTPIGILEISSDDPQMALIRDRAVVIGLGYIGLTLACALADAGIETHGVETDQSKRKSLETFTDYTGEPGVQNLLTKHLGKKLSVHSSVEDLPVISSGRRNVFIICVGTPLVTETEVDRSFLESAIKDILRIITRNSLIVLRSTVPIGTTRELAKRIENARGWRVDSDCFVANAPERTVEGDALRELRKLPQLVSGVTNSCTNRVIDFFRPISEAIVNMESPEAAELAKLGSNAYRDYVFGFAKHLASLSLRHGIDVNQMIGQMNSGYSRNAVPQPSPGVGGPCLEKDSWILELGSDEPHLSPILAARRRNQAFVQEVVSYVDKTFVSAHVTEVLCVGLAFKGVPSTPDLRGSPGVEIARGLASKGYKLRGLDAVANLEDLDIEPPDSSFNPGAVLLLNNHVQNVELLETFLIARPEKHFLIFDPWRLLDHQWFRSFALSGPGFTVMSLSHSWEVKA